MNENRPESPEPASGSAQLGPFRAHAEAIVTRPVPPKCPFPDPASLDNDALASVAATLAGLLEHSRGVYENNPNPVTKWMMHRDELAADYVSALVEFRFGQALEGGELDEGPAGDVT
jgi:hypothetical protein